MIHFLLPGAAVLPQPRDDHRPGLYDSLREEIRAVKVITEIIIKR